MQISVTNGDLWREERIKKTLRIAGKILGLSNDQFELLIDEIHDSKGQLAIYWKTPHTIRQESAFSDAWTECGEHAANIWHYEGGSK
jgi:hypothetical protein